MPERKRMRFGARWRGRRRIREDLERKGVSGSFSDPIAARLEGIEPRMTPGEYGAALDGVALAFAVYRSDHEALEASARDIDEIQRLMEGFAEELRKLEEGLQIVSAYVLRMHDKASRDRGGMLH